MEEASRRTSRILSETPALRDELLTAASAGRMPALAKMGIDADMLDAALGSKRSRAGVESVGERPSPIPSAGLEAIVRSVGRPSLLVTNGTYERPKSDAVRKQLEPHRKRIEKVVSSVGRIEFRFHRAPWGGTGWMIGKNLVITNRHVAELVAERNGLNGFRFRASPMGKSYEARIDFREEFEGLVSEEAPLVSVKFLATLQQHDIALFEVKADGFALPQPLPLTEKSVAGKLAIGVVGYPADDPDRNDPGDIARYFGDIFDVKRFAFGEITQAPDDGVVMHDATTLGGNSGSVVFDLATGNVVGLHFAGEYQIGNYAVDAETLKKVLRGLKTVVSGAALPTEKRDGQHRASFFKGRRGYDSGFLDAEVKLPGLKAWSNDAAEFTAEDGKKSTVLPYRHFSVVYSTSRKVPIFTAVNIDGAQSSKIKRGDDQWFQDLRLPIEIQLGEKDYGRDVIDRGHMVRREDPVWGSEDEATEANFDTFHYTNAAPQHADLNQRATAWLGLENFILENTRTLGLKASVFTGPVLRKDDRSDEKFPKLGPIPREFWKVVVAIDAETRKPYATGFVLTQGKMIADFTEAIVFGDWNSFQVPISQIAAATGLDLGGFEKIDTMNKAGAKPAAKKKKPAKKKAAAKGKKRGRAEAAIVTSGPAPILLTSPRDVFLG